MKRLTYQFPLADDLNSDTIAAIKAAFKSKAIRLIVEIEEDNQVLSDELKAILDERLGEDVATFISSKQSLAMLREKHAL